MKQKEFYHVSVLLCECINLLNIKQNGTYVDATLGGAGHSFEIAKRLSKDGKLICIDKDETALENARFRLEPFLDRVALVKSDFKMIDSVISNEGFEKVDGILFDLGVSSPQLDEAERGFSYMKNAPLDMRMDKKQSFTAYDVVNNYDENELKRIISKYGEEKYSNLIATNIIKARKQKKIETTFELVDIIKKSMPAKALREKQHPAKRTFQAIRIEVNDELGAIKEALQKSINILNVGGRLGVISFHSLEDRIVKEIMKKSAQGCTCPKDFPVCVCKNEPKIKLISRKPVLPNESEICNNLRARSAKLRVCEKL